MFTQKTTNQPNGKKHLAYKNKCFLMSSEHLYENTISLKAKGLMSLLLTENINYSIQGLISICKESRDSIRSALRELQRFGYLSIVEERNEKGQFTNIYNIYESPKDNPFFV
jgi:hypothetical protein